MSSEDLIGLILSIATVGYLVVALLMPEKL